MNPLPQEDGEPIGHLARLLRAELSRLNSFDGEDRWVQWIAERLVDPRTGQKIYASANSGRTFVTGLLTKPRDRDPLPSTYRALAALFELPINQLRDAVALDIDAVDASPRREWPSFVHPAVSDASSKGRAFLREASEMVARSEGLI